MTVGSLIPSFTSGEMVLLAIIVIVGAVIIIVLSALIHFIIPIIAAVVVWLFTGSLLYAAIVFIGVAILELMLRR